MKFKGFALIRLDKAIGESTDVTTKCDYELSVFDKMGRETKQVLKAHQIDSEFCRLRMKEDRFARMDGGTCIPISEEKFLADLEKWKSI